MFYIIQAKHNINTCKRSVLLNKVSSVDKLLPDLNSVRLTTLIFKYYMCLVRIGCYKPNLQEFPLRYFYNNFLS